MEDTEKKEGPGFAAFIAFTVYAGWRALREPSYEEGTTSMKALAKCDACL